MGDRLEELRRALKPFIGWRYMDTVLHGPGEAESAVAARVNALCERVEYLRERISDPLPPADLVRELTERLFDLDWTDYYPEIDGLGELTGVVVDADDDNYVVIDDIVMIDKHAQSADTPWLLLANNLAADSGGGSYIRGPRTHT